MPHIHKNPGEHDITVSAYIVRVDLDEPESLFHRHKLLGNILQYGGHVELKENPWQAMVNEIKDETGYEASQLNILQPRGIITKLSDTLLHPYPLAVQTHRFGNTDHFHTDMSYAFTAKEGPKNKIKDCESTEKYQFTEEQLKSLPVGALPENVRETGLFVLSYCLSNWKEVPATSFGVSLPD